MTNPINPARASAPTGSDFREARRSSGVTMHKAAIDLGCSYSCLSMYENGHTGHLSIALAKAATRVLRKYQRAAAKASVTA